MNPKHSSKALYKYIVDALSTVYGRKESRQIGRLVMEEVIGISFEKILIDDPVPDDLGLMDALEEKIELLKKNMPVQYVLGKAHFYGREFTVSPAVLIPRQETEELVREIIQDNHEPDLKILDVGTGSGCIGITLALEMRRPRITVLDIERDALEMAFENAQRYDVDLEYIVDDVLDMPGFPERYHVIVSNPPYVTHGERKWMHPNVLDHEPEKALFVPDEDPFIFYRKIVQLARQYLFAGGRMYLEINEHFGNEMIRLCEKSGCTCVRIFQDINGKDRFLKARFD